MVLSRTSIVLSQVYDIVPCVDPEMFCRGGVRGIFKFAMGWGGGVRGIFSVHLPCKF